MTITLVESVATEAARADTHTWEVRVALFKVPLQLYLSFSSVAAGRRVSTALRRRDSRRRPNCPRKNPYSQPPLHT